MTRREQVAALQAKPHHVYVHFDAAAQPIYVGRTSDPANRPLQAVGREWIAQESDRVEVSPQMSFEAACWTEAYLIRSLRPRHNTQQGTEKPDIDWRVNRLVEVEGLARSAARWAVKHMPTDREDFEALLAKRAANAGRPEPELLNEALAGLPHLDPLARSARSRRSR